ncbi:hypothetical protein DYBT9275_05845 [Dyadobacter sp. CECT 9275]|uniref:Uncharacterized protein n=1 Tax=Dyadobacter helix TaxID=2822344 RepID=A0A916JHT6_9BACT|nr:hypothetical protein [Dyadobacter sp. CECT 9275]CAG5017778.1 hypothetical protein DYBT9275_05845 [Dyadobacter sp. CECT 9275]
MKKISLNRKVYHLPENWTEVKKEDLPVLLRLLYTQPPGGSTYLEILRIALGHTEKEWFKLMRHYFGPKRSESQVNRNANILAETMNLVSWMWQADLIIPPFESFQVNSQPWLLFEEGFKSMSFGEMADAHIHAQAFIKQLIAGEQRLNLLVASVCRPELSGDYKSDPEWNGDRREPYNEHVTRLRAESLNDNYAAEKILVLMYFLGSLKEFFSFYDLFENDGSAPPVAEDYPGQSLVKNQHLLSEKHIFGGMSATKAANVHEVFQFLEEHRKDIKAQNQRSKQAHESY